MQCGTRGAAPPGPAPVNEALRASLLDPVAVTAPLRLVTYGKGARRVRHEPVDFARVQEREERGALRRRALSSARPKPAK